VAEVQELRDIAAGAAEVELHLSPLRFPTPSAGVLQLLDACPEKRTICDDISCGHTLLQRCGACGLGLHSGKCISILCPKFKPVYPVPREFYRAGTGAGPPFGYEKQV
jgi:hypothetical protein